ncbi:MAG: hypothetical protein U0R19_16545 [Bryobacteraceae bacterium]
MKRMMAVVIWAVCRLPGQTPVVLDIDVSNTTAYYYDNFEPPKYGTNPNQMTTGAVTNFYSFLNFGDLTAVNGEPAKGTWVARVVAFRMATSSVAGQMIGDMNRFGIAEFQIEVLRADGVVVGSIFMQGQNFGPATPGAPTVSNGGAFAVVGGTGAFLGARGQMTTAPSRTGGGARNTSVQEDPSLRRTRPGGGQRLIIQLIPNQTPEFAMEGGEPQVFHADFTRVSAASPARAGETLLAMVKGLGATTPALDAGASFSSDPLSTAIAPVSVVVNGNATPALTQVGWPGTTDSYRVDFRVPDDTRPGAAVLRLRAAWVPGAETRIAVR